MSSRARVHWAQNLGLVSRLAVVREGGEVCVVWIADDGGGIWHQHHCRKKWGVRCQGGLFESASLLQIFLPFPTQDKPCSPTWKSTQISWSRQVHWRFPRHIFWSVVAPVLVLYSVTCSFRMSDDPRIEHPGPGRREPHLIVGGLGGPFYQIAHPECLLLARLCSIVFHLLLISSS